jgi:dolichol-phosphate mannosyltransferase
MYGWKNTLLAATIARNPMTKADQNSNLPLAVVVPVYNEQESIEIVIHEWADMLSKAVEKFVFLCVDDGSTDQSAAILQKLLGVYPLHIHHTQRQGHGGACRHGYLQAITLHSAYILQIDSDGQSDPSFFPKLWDQRQPQGVVYGIRLRRMDGLHRKLISKFLRQVIRYKTGIDCPDANSPYRLMSSASLKAGLDVVPQHFDMFNIALAIQLQQLKFKQALLPIVFRNRHYGKSHTNFIQISKKAIRLIKQLNELPQIR